MDESSATIFCLIICLCCISGWWQCMGPGYDGKVDKFKNIMTTILVSPIFAATGYLLYHLTTL